MAAKRYFTLAEAEGLIPRLQSVFERLLQLHGHLRATGDRLVLLGHPPAQALLEGEELSGPPGVQQLQARFRALYEAIGADVAEVGALGGEVKDLEKGLCDFPTMLGGREEVLLCWRVGERCIQWWHDRRSGFAGRKPIGGRVFVAPHGRAAH